jgi:hypothetical protein
MKPVECEFEAEVLAAALQGRWPERVDAQLLAHAAGCAICGDTAAVASAIEEAREEVRACAAVPDGGYVWWRAQLRARREAAKVAEHPMTVAQLIAFGCVIGLLGACFGATSSWFQSALRRITAGVAELNLHAVVPAATALIAGHGVLVVSMAAVLLLIPAAVGIAMLKD